MSQLISVIMWLYCVRPGAHPLHAPASASFRVWVKHRPNSHVHSTYLPASAAADDAPIWPQLAAVKDVCAIQQGIGLRMDSLSALGTAGLVLAEAEGLETLP